MLQHEADVDGIERAVRERQLLSASGVKCDLAFGYLLG